MSQHRLLKATLSVGGVVAAVLIALVASKTPGEQQRSERTEGAIRCIKRAAEKYFDVNNNVGPETIEESLRAAVSERYRYEKWCSCSPVRDEILAGRDAWGRPFEFERRDLRNGWTEVTIISYGNNGQRDYVEPGNRGDDLAATFYLVTGAKTGQQKPSP